MAEIKDITAETFNLIADIAYKEKIEYIDANFETFMDGADNLNQTLS